MVTQTERKIAEEQRKTYEIHQMAQEQRQELVRATAMANIQQEMVQSEQGVQIADLKSQAVVKGAHGDAEATKLKALGEAAAIRTTGKAKAEAYLAGVEALGVQGYTAVQLMQIVGEQQVRVVPDVSVSGSSGSGMIDGLMGLLLRHEVKENGVEPVKNGSNS